MTLLELAAVVLIVGMLGIMAATRYGGSAVTEVGTEGFAQRLVLDCLQARRRAISTGDAHLLRFTITGGEASQYALYRSQGGSDVRVDDFRAVPDGVTVATGGATDLVFNFLGEAAASYSITVTGPNRSWSVTVPQLTGKAFLDEL